MGGPGSGRRASAGLTSVKAPKSRALTVAGEMLRLLRADLERLEGTQWPNSKWEADPVGFVREVLGETPLPWQEDILTALVAPRARVTVRSCHKAGKTKLLVWAALWFYCSFPRASVNLSADNAKQIRRVDWKELRTTIYEARKRGFVVENPAEDPATGLVSEDGRAVFGFTTRNIEGWGGISSPNLLFMIDEASSLDSGTAEAIEGNTAGGARMLYISNPTRAEGPFFDTFHKQKAFWTQFHLDAEVIAAWCDANNVHIPGIAEGVTIREWKEKYGEDSPFYRVRARGEFVINEAGKCISLDLIFAAQERYADAPEEGALTLGIDPAGPGLGGDKWGFCVTRGAKVLLLVTKLGLTEEAGLDFARGLIATYRRGDELPRAMVDAEGPIGSAFYGRLKGIAQTCVEKRPELAFEVFAVKASARARRAPLVYNRVRQELWANAAAWLKDGGAIPVDYELEAELHLPNFTSTVQGLLDMTSKDEFREKLERSPDKADAFLLSIWNPAPWLDDADTETGAVAAPQPSPGRVPMADWANRGAAALGSPYDLLNGVMGPRRG